MARSRTGLSYLKPNTTTTQSPVGIFPARVEFVLLDNETDKTKFKNLGEWSGIGSILFSRIKENNRGLNNKTVAKPLFSNLKNYPLINELVYIIALPNADIQIDPNDVSFYYFQSVNVWNSSHHNAIPNALSDLSIPESQTMDYLQVEGGTVRRVTDEGTEINLGNTFIERLSVKNTQAFEGDVIHEGRWGQSLRFGSTVTDSNIFNPWSIAGTNGDPITILRNDQHDDGKDPWIPQVEDINKDESSIYLTSTQKIPIDVASNRYKSYDSGLEPQDPKTYSNSQIILNAGRLLFNAYDDSILLASNDSINLNTQESVNIDAVEGLSVSVGNQSEILLGSNDFSVIEPVILGDKFLADIENLANILISLGNNFELNPMLTSEETANADLLTIGGDIRDAAQTILNNIENYKSKVTFSK